MDTAGQHLCLHWALVSWVSRTQPVVAKSTTEVYYGGYIATNEAGSEGVWFWALLEELGIFIDNQSTFKVGHNPEDHSCMKHINTTAP